MVDVQRLRAETARDLLLTTDLPLKTIAGQVGSANEYHLSRLVRQHLSMTPSEIRQRIKQVAPPVVDVNNYQVLPAEIPAAKPQV